MRIYSASRIKISAKTNFDRQFQLLKIPVFVSIPTKLSPTQVAAKELVFEELDALGMEPRSLGTTDFPADLPLREVTVIARQCSGAVILGFKQIAATTGRIKEGTAQEKVIEKPIYFPSAWNNLEAGVLFALKRPLLVFREEGIEGGVFDNGVTDVFIHQMPQPPLEPPNRSALREVFLNWQRRVRNLYYGD